MAAIIARFFEVKAEVCHEISEAVPHASGKLRDEAAR